MDEDIYVALIHQEIENVISSENREKLSAWRDANKVNEQLYQTTISAWDESIHYGNHISVDLDADYNILQKKILTQQESKPALSLFKRYRVQLGIAASLVFLMLAYTGLRTTSTTILASIDKQLVILPDGSEVNLSRGSSLTYKSGFEKNRNLELKGEAYFSVEHDTQHPFLVKSEHFTVEVLGTEFVLSDDDQNDRPQQVQLIEGSISVLNNKDGTSTILSPGQKIDLNDLDVMQPISATRLIEQKWFVGELNFEDEELSAVMEDLSNLYGVSIELNSKVSSCSFTGQLSSADISQILENISQVYGALVTESDGSYYITGGECN